LWYDGPEVALNWLFAISLPYVTPGAAAIFSILLTHPVWRTLPQQVTEMDTEAMDDDEKDEMLGGLLASGSDGLANGDVEGSMVMVGGLAHMLNADPAAETRRRRRRRRRRRSLLSGTILKYLAREKARYACEPMLVALTRGSLAFRMEGTHALLRREDLGLHPSFARTRQPRHL
jgi:hypothetical protein